MTIRSRATRVLATVLTVAGLAAVGVATVTVPAAADPPLAPYGVPTVPPVQGSPNYSGQGGITDLNDEGDLLAEVFAEYNQAVLLLADGTQISLNAAVPCTVIATALNNSATVVTYCQDGHDAYVYANGIATRLPTLPGVAETRATDINDSGTVVGQLYPDYIAVRWSGPQHTLSRIDPGDPTANVLVLNDAGWSAGSVQGHAASFSPQGVAHPLQQLRGESASLVTGINRYGVMVGTSTVGQRNLPVEWQPDGTVTRLATRKGRTCYGVKINDSGHVVATLYRFDFIKMQSVYWADPTRLTNLPNAALRPGFAQYAVSTINNEDVIGGVASPNYMGEEFPIPLLWAPNGS